MIGIAIVFLRKYWYLPIIAGVILIYFINPFSLFGKSTKLTVMDTPLSLRDINSIGELITSEYHGEVLQSLKEMYRGTEEENLNASYNALRSTFRDIAMVVPSRKSKKRARLFFKKINSRKKEFSLFKKMAEVKDDEEFLDLMDTTEWQSFEKKYKNQVLEVVQRFGDKELKNADLIYLGRGSVKAGFDLSELKLRNINWRGDTLILSNFNPKILDVNINPLYIPQLNIPGFQLIRASKEGEISFDEIAMVKNACREKLKKEAIDRKIFDRSISAAEETLETFFGFLSNNKKLKKVIIEPSAFFRISEKVLVNQNIDSTDVDELKSYFEKDTLPVDGLKFLEKLQLSVNPKDIAPSFFPLYQQIKTDGRLTDIPHVSPHHTHLDSAKRNNLKTEQDWDNHFGITHKAKVPFTKKATKKYKVMGWHPYYMGTAYKSYHFEQLWAVSYFSYELDSKTGGYKTVHNWKTTKLFEDAAKFNTKVLLTVTNFGATENRIFLNSPSAQSKLIEELKALLDLRKGHGVNIDFEEIPGDCRGKFTEFITNLSSELKKHNKSYLISLNLYSVDWQNVFEISKLNKFTDLFILMGYDYYYANSSNAGPVSPLHSGKEWLPYNLNRSVNHYRNEGLPKNKLIVALPYYGREWKTRGGANPEKNIKYLKAPIYRDLRKIKEFSSSEFDSISSSAYLNISDGEKHKQIWYDDAYTLGLKYNWIKDRNLAGVGIWALGYDHGYNELWQELNRKFSK